MAGQRRRFQPVLVYALFSMAVAYFETPARLRVLATTIKTMGKALQDQVHVPDRSAIAEASELIDRFGIHALSEAAARADRSRELGNVIHFCRWRQIERIIPILASDRAQGTIH